MDPRSRYWPVLLFLVLIAGTLWCQTTAPVTLQVAPKDLSMSAGEQRQVLVIASVSGNAVRKLRLHAQAEPGTRVNVGRSAKLPGEVRGDVSWPVSITKAADGRTASRIVFEAQYETGDPTSPVPGVASVALDLTIKQLPKNEEVATAVVQTSFDKLEERRPQDVYLVVTNLTDVPLEVTEVSANLPAFVSVSTSNTSAATPQGSTVTSSSVFQGAGLLYSSAGQVAPLMIPPRQDHIFHMVLQIPDYTAVLTGKYLMLFDVKLRYTKDGYTTNSSITTNKEFQAGVLGEQEFVGVTSVPFLLLPGFLVVTILGLLLTKVWPKSTLEIDYKKPEFYLIGTAVSLVFVLAYHPASRWLYWQLWHVKLPSRDLFSGFSLEDIINIWVIAVAVAVLPWAVIGGGARLWAAARARRQREITPTPLDEPLNVLYRLQKAGKSFRLAQANMAGRAGQPLWELPLPTPDPAKKWVSGRIRVMIPAALAEGELQPTVATFRSLLNDDTGAQTKALYDLLNGVKDKIHIRWDPDQPPLLVDNKDALTAPGKPDEFILEKA